MQLSLSGYDTDNHRPQFTASLCGKVLTFASHRPVGVVQFRDDGLSYRYHPTQPVAGKPSFVGTIAYQDGQLVAFGRCCTVTGRYMTDAPVTQTIRLLKVRAPGKRSQIVDLVPHTVVPRHVSVCDSQRLVLTLPRDGGRSYQLVSEERIERVRIGDEFYRLLDKPLGSVHCLTDAHFDVGPDGICVQARRVGPGIPDDGHLHHYRVTVLNFASGVIMPVDELLALSAARRRAA